MSAPQDTLIRRSLRRFTLGSGPLKRRSDRLQVLGRILVALSFLAAPPIAVAVSTATAVHLQAVSDAETAERSSTQAVLLEDAGDPQRYAGSEGGGPQVVQAQATWTGPDGIPREGVVLVPPRTGVGTAVPVWVDQEGNLTRAPRDPADIPATAYAVGALPLLGVPVVTWMLYGVLSFVLDARRERLWEQQWAVVEPKWNSRLM